MSLTLEAAGDLAGGHCWIERRLFEVLGAWGASAGDPRVVLLLDRHSQHASWRAEQWWDRLPVLAGVDREELVAPPAGWTELLGASGAHAPAPDGDAAILAVTHRVAVPRLVARYASHRRVASRVSDGPALRTLGHAGDDARADWEEGELVLQQLIVSGDDLDACAAAQRRAEDAVARVGYRTQP